MKMLNLFQTSIRDQKQLVNQIENRSGHLPQQKEDTTTISTTTHASVVVLPPIKKNTNKPSLMRQPNTIIIPSKTERTTLVVEENKMVPAQLKQILIHVKKAIALLTTDDTVLVQQLKPIFQKISSICNTKSTKLTTTTTTKSSSETVVKRRSTTTNNMSHNTNIADSHREIQRYVCNIKNKPRDD